MPPADGLCRPAGPQAIGGPSAPCSPLSFVLLGWPPLWGYPHHTPAQAPSQPRSTVGSTTQQGPSPCTPHSLLTAPIYAAPGRLSLVHDASCFSRIGISDPARPAEAFSGAASPSLLILFPVFIPLGPEGSRLGGHGRDSPVGSRAMGRGWHGSHRGSPGRAGGPGGVWVCGHAEKGQEMRGRAEQQGEPAPHPGEEGPRMGGGGRRVPQAGRGERPALPGVWGCPPERWVASRVRGLRPRWEQSGYRSRAGHPGA